MPVELVVGYDPGGDHAHGVALLTMANGSIQKVSTQTFDTAEDVIEFIENLAGLTAVGVDTLTCWSTGASGWRPADRWLRARYRDVRNSVMTPNGLAGSMGLNGMSVLMATRRKFPDVSIIETHPKVLYWALKNVKHNYESTKPAMEQVLRDFCGVAIATLNDHEWDAALSAIAAVRGVLREWTFDLHALPTKHGERLITPCGQTNYFWPEGGSDC